MPRQTALTIPVARLSFALRRSGGVRDAYDEADEFAILAAFAGSCGCATPRGPNLLTPVPEQYNLPPDDARFTQPASYPKDVLNQDPIREGQRRQLPSQQGPMPGPAAWVAAAGARRLLRRHREYHAISFVSSPREASSGVLSRCRRVPSSRL